MAQARIDERRTHGCERIGCERIGSNGLGSNGFEVRPISGSIGAEILGIDLAAEPGHNVIAAIRQAWLEHGVIFFRDQDLPPAKFLAFAKCFGEVVEYPFIKGIEGFPEIIPVVKLEHEKHNFGGIWHSDTSYLDDAADGHHADRARGPAARRRHPVRRHGISPTNRCPTA